MARLYTVTLVIYLIFRVHTQNAGLNDSQAGMKIAGRNNNFRYADDTTLMVGREKELRSLLVNVKEESEKLA